MSDIKTLYTAHVHVTGGREGAARSSDGRLDLKLAVPGSPGAGTNPEQLFVAGWSACFEGAMAIAAKGKGMLIGRAALFMPGTTYGEPWKCGAFQSRSYASSLSGFEISPVLLSGHTTRRSSNSIHSHLSAMISDIRAAKANCRQIANV
jgi:hypothetical protein